MVAIDDFGTGFLFKLLTWFDIDVLKIDRSFIADYPAYDDGVIFKAMVTMARELKIPVLAEGIELKEQLNFLKSMDVAFYQGFLFSKAIDESSFFELLKKES